MPGDLQGIRFPLVLLGEKSSAAATNEELLFAPVPAGRIHVITNLSFIDETNAFTSALIYLKRGTLTHKVLEDYSLLAGRLYWCDTRIWIPEAFQLVVRLVGTTNLDVLKAYVNGFQLVQPEDFGR